MLSGKQRFLNLPKAKVEHYFKRFDYFRLNVVRFFIHRLSFGNYVEFVAIFMNVLRFFNLLFKSVAIQKKISITLQNKYVQFLAKICK